jgi:octanoyl-[GcvH]:protein N-octanoyltransferase
VATRLQIVGDSWPNQLGLDTAVSRAILDRVSAGEAPATLRLYVPRREVAFGRRDTVSPRYPAARRAAAAAGFAGIERLAGGRAAVFTEHTVAFALALPDPSPRDSIGRHFVEMAEAVVAALRRVGVGTTVGEVPGEYCPGAYSVNHAGRIKLMGVGQRLARHATHVGGVIVAARSDLVRRALVPVYRALEVPWEPATAGAVDDVAPGVTPTDVLEAMITEFSTRYDAVAATVPDAIVAAALPNMGDYAASAAP